MLSLLFLLSTLGVAHEAYTVPRDQFLQGLEQTTTHPLAPLTAHHHLWLSAALIGFVGLTYLIEVLFIATETGYEVDTLIKQGEKYGPVIVRVAVGLSFLFAAYTDSVFGPELSLLQLPFPVFVKFTSFAVGFMLVFGFLVEVAAAVGIVIFALTALQYGEYLLTYANYLGELLVLLLFGSRYLSIDKLLYGERDWLSWLDAVSEYELPIIRIFYGIALIYAGVTVKFLHQHIAVAVFHQYHLGQIFP
ncbi:MAG: hypothetical protein SVU32_03290, partial [Candidatus Nanohaloarchaea archaeon]|nr:hypothetical protein [Candidatus Nanohaloarchaea archaeon]